jgi:hypothetical protein
VGFDITDRLMMRFSAFIRYWRENGNTMRQYYKLFLDFTKAYDSVMREVLFIHSFIFSSSNHTGDNHLRYR